MEKKFALKKSSLVVFGVFVTFALLTFSGLKTFDAWGQVTLLWNSGQPLLYFADHFHFERYLASYPGLIMESKLPGFGFSLYVCAFVALNTLLFRRVHMALYGYPPRLFVYAVFILIHLAMNGRGPIGWAGWLLCLDLHGALESRREDETHFMTTPRSLQLFLALLFSSVSSGVFLVTLIASAFLIYRSTKSFDLSAKFTKRRILSMLLIVMIVSYTCYRSAIYLFEAVTKILLFFGSFQDVIVHGIGVIALRFDIALLFVGLAVFALVSLVIVPTLKTRVRPILWPLLGVALVGGAFGFTTLTLTLPIFLILFSALTRPLVFRASGIHSAKV